MVEDGTVTFRRTEYPVNTTIAAVNAKALPRGDWIGETLRTALPLVARPQPVKRYTRGMAELAPDVRSDPGAFGRSAADRARARRCGKGSTTFCAPTSAP